MKKAVLLCLALVLVLAAPVFAGGPEMTDAEKQQLIDHLKRTEAKFLASVKGLSDAQWKYKAAEDKWSIAQCAEHIAVSEGFIRSLVEKSLNGAAIETADGQKDARKDEMVLTFIVDRSKKFQAPEPVAPANRFASGADAVGVFEKERATTLDLAGGASNFRGHWAQHPGFGPLDSYGWMLFLSGHTERHTLQIEEVKASPGFPKE